MKYRRACTPGGTFFFTVVCCDRKPLLAGDEPVSLLREAFRYVLDKHPFQIDACVILPDHLHTIWTLPPNDTDFSTRWRLLKSYFSHRLKNRPQIQSPSRLGRQEQAVWQHRFWEHLIRNDEDYKNHLDYIHYNPVKHGLVASPADWHASSFLHWVKRGVYTVDWAAAGIEWKVECPD